MQQMTQLQQHYLYVTTMQSNLEQMKTLTVSANQQLES